MVYFPTGFDEEEKKKKNIFQRFSEFVTGSEEVGQRMEERRSQGKELLPDVSNIRETTEKINKNLQNFADFYLNLGREPRNFVVDFFQNLFNIDKDKEKQGLQLVKPVHAADFPSTFEEEEKKKTLSQQAGEDIKTNYRFFSPNAFEEIEIEEPTPTVRPTPTPQPEQKPGLIQRAGTFIKGILPFGKKLNIEAGKILLGEPIKSFEQRAEIFGIDKDKYINEYIAPVMQAREETGRLLVEAQNDLDRFYRENTNTKFHPPQEIKAGKSPQALTYVPNKYKKEYQEKLYTVENLERALNDYDQFLEKEPSNRGALAELWHKFTREGRTLVPGEKSRYAKFVATKEREAIEKYQRGKELTSQESGFIQSFRARGYNDLMEKGLGTLAGDVLADMPGYILTIYATSGLVSPVTEKLGKTILTSKMAPAILKKAAPSILKNSVNMALASNLNFPGISAATAEYMLPTVDYQAMLNETGKTKDILKYVKPGDAPMKAFKKAYLTNLVEYLSEGASGYIDDAGRFVKKAFVGKWLGKKLAGKTVTSGLIASTLRQAHFDSIVSEVLEEELGEPFQAAIEERDYDVPFFTPEGRERILVEALTIVTFAGMAGVSNTVIEGAQTRRIKTKDVIDVPVQEVSPSIKLSDRERGFADQVINFNVEGTKVNVDKINQAMDLLQQGKSALETTKAVGDMGAVQFASQINKGRPLLAYADMVQKIGAKNPSADLYQLGLDIVSEIDSDSKYEKYRSGMTSLRKIFQEGLKQLAGVEAETTLKGKPEDTTGEVEKEKVPVEEIPETLTGLTETAREAESQETFVSQLISQSGLKTLSVSQKASLITGTGITEITDGSAAVVERAGVTVSRTEAGEIEPIQFEKNLNEFLQQNPQVVNNFYSRATGLPTTSPKVAKIGEATVVKTIGEYQITVNDLKNPTYLAVFKNGEKVGDLRTANKAIGIPNYVQIGNVQINRADRRQGLATELYKTLLKYLPAGKKGLVGYRPDIANKKAIAAIYKRLGGYEEKDGNFYIEKIKKLAPEKKPVAGKKAEPKKVEVKKGDKVEYILNGQNVITGTVKKIEGNRADVEIDQKETIGGRSLKKIQNVPLSVLSPFGPSQIKIKSQQKKPIAKKKVEPKTIPKIWSAVTKKGKMSLGILNQVAVRKDKLEISALGLSVSLNTDQKEGLYTIVGNDLVESNLDIKDFPEIPRPEKEIAQVAPENLTNVLKKAVNFIDKNGAHPILNSINIIFGQDGAKVTATDGFTLFYEKLDIKLISPVTFNLGLSTQMVSVLDKLKTGGTFTTRYDGKTKYVSFSNQYGTVVGMVIEGEFPNCKKIFFRQTKHYRINKTDLSQAVKDLTPYVKDTANVVIVTFKENELVLRGGKDKTVKTITIPVKVEDANTGDKTLFEGVVVMPIRVEKATGNQINFNVDYLARIAKTFDGNQVYISPTFEENKISLEKAVFFGQEKPTADKGGYVSSRGYASRGIFADLENITQKLEQQNFKIVPFPELVSMAKELMGQVPKITGTKRGKYLGFFKPIGRGQILLQKKVFTDPVQAAKLLSHEIGHLVDYFPDLILERGNLVGHIATLRGYLKDAYGDLSNKETRKELMGLSAKWRPAKGGRGKAEDLIGDKYRSKATELYADAISVLFNDPARLQLEAPKFFLAWTNYLDRKPEVRDEYMKIQQLLTRGTEELNKQRLDKLYQGFEEARIKRKELFDQELGKKSLLFRATSQLVTKFHPVYEKYNQLVKEGRVTASEKQRVRNVLEEMQYSRNDIWVDLIRNEEEVMDVIKNNGITENQLGAWFVLERNLNDRIKLANPDGLIGGFNQEVLDYLASGFTAKQQEAIKRAANNFHKATFDLADTMHKEGMINNEVFREKIEPFRDSYVTYSVVDYIDKNYITPYVKQMKGTLKQVENPLVSTMLKRGSMIQAINIHRGKREIIKLLNDYFPTEIDESKSMLGKMNQRFFYKAFGKGQIQLFEDGKWASYDVDPYFSDIFKHIDPQQLFVLVDIANQFNKRFKPVVTTYKLGWAVYSNPVKDVKRTMKNLAAISAKEGIKFSRARFLSDWVKTIPQGFKFAKGELEPFVKEALGAKAITTPFISYDPTAGEDEALYALYRRYRFLPGKDTVKNNKKVREKILAPIKSILGAIETAGATFENDTKLASFKYLNREIADPKKVAFYTRNYTGTPPFQEGGTLKPVSNSLWVFSNVMIQGLRMDAELVRSSPGSAGAYFFEMFLQSGLWKLLMVIAAGGFLGKELEEMYEGMTEYDKTNYITIPLGFVQEGKIAYWRIPEDEVNRLAGAIIWKIGTALEGKAVKTAQILDVGAGWIPSMTPLFDTIGAWWDYLRGVNPYDSYYGRNVLDTQTYQIGGIPALTKMSLWTLNNVGLGNFATYDPVEKTTTERIIQHTPLLNRAIRITDYGKTEIEKEIEKQELRTRAIQNRKEREIVNKLAGQYLKEGGAKDDYKRLITGQVYPSDYGLTSEDKSNVKRLESDFDKEVLRRTGDARTKVIVKLTLNTSKINALKRYRQEMSEQDFGVLMDVLLENKVISQTVYDKVWE